MRLDLYISSLSFSCSLFFHHTRTHAHIYIYNGYLYNSDVEDLRCRQTVCVGQKQPLSLDNVIDIMSALSGLSDKHFQLSSLAVEGELLAAPGLLLEWSILLTPQLSSLSHFVIPPPATVRPFGFVNFQLQ